MNFQSFGVRGALAQMFKLSNREVTAIKKKEKTANYLTAPFRGEQPRVIRFNYSVYKWFVSNLAAYDHLMTGILDSWLLATQGNEITSCSTQTNFRSVLNDFAEALRSANHRHLNVQPVRWKNPPPFLLQRFQESEITVPNMYILRVKHESGRNNTHYSRSYESRSDSCEIDNYTEFDGAVHGSTYYIFMYCPVTEKILAFRAKKSVFDQVNNNLTRRPDNTDQEWRSLSLEEATVTVDSLASVTYVIAETPSNYDAAHNNQLWLPLTNEEGYVFTRDNTVFTHDTRVVWKMQVDEDLSSWNYVNTPAGDRLSEFEFKTSWIGTAYGAEPKNALMDYELTTDERELGRGKIFVGKDDVCYCPHTGYPLRCELSYQAYFANRPKVMVIG